MRSDEERQPDDFDQGHRDQEYEMVEVGGGPDAEFPDDERLIQDDTEGVDEVGVWMYLVWFMTWATWAKNLGLGFIAGTLAPSAVALPAKFRGGRLTTWWEVGIYLAVSGISGILGVARNQTMSTRSAFLSRYQADLATHAETQKNLNAYALHLSRVQNLFNNPHFRDAYTQCFAPHAILDNKTKQLAKMVEFRAELEAFLEEGDPAHDCLSVYNLLATPIATGGMIVWFWFTPDGVLKDLATIPDAIYQSAYAMFGVLGLWVFIELILGNKSAVKSEKETVLALLDAERKTEASLEECNELLGELNALIKEANPETDLFARSNWSPDAPLEPVAVWLKKREAGASYQAQGFFTVSGGASAKAWYPRRLKAIKVASGPGPNIDVHRDGNDNNQGYKP